MAVAVNPIGRVSVMVMVPTLGPDPTLLAVMLYVAPV
jgi:hypothetical protein